MARDQKLVYKLKPKKEQDFRLLLEQILDAGADLCGTNFVQIRPELLDQKKKSRKTVLCESCGEAFKVGNGNVCPGCLGDSPYLNVK